MSLARRAVLAATLLGSAPAMAEDVRARDFFHDNCLQANFVVDGLKGAQAKKLTAFLEKEMVENLKRPDADALCMDNDPRTAIALPVNVKVNEAKMSSRAVVTSNDPHRACLHVAQRNIRPRDAANTEWAFLKPRFSEGDVIPFELDVNGVAQRAFEICSADGHLVSKVQGSHLASKAFASAYDEIVSSRTGVVDFSKLDGYASSEALKPGGDLLVKLNSELGPEHTRRWQGEFDAAAQLLSAYLIENSLRFKPSDDSHELRLTLLDRAKYVDFVHEDGLDYLRRPEHIRYMGLAVANLEWDRNGYYGTDDFTIPFASFKECRDLCEEGSLTPDEDRYPTSSLSAQIPKSEMHQVIAYYMYMALQEMDALEDFDYGSLEVSAALATPPSEEPAVTEAPLAPEEDLCAEYQGEGLKKRFRGVSVLGIGFDRNIPEVCAEKEATTAINANPNVGGVNLGIRFEIADKPQAD